MSVQTPDWMIQVLAMVAFEVESLDDDPEEDSVHDWEAYERNEKLPYFQMAWDVAAEGATLETFLDKHARPFLADYPDPIDAKGLLDEETDRFHAMQNVLGCLRSVRKTAEQSATKRMKQESAQRKARRVNRSRKP